jgi:hypothetical protein
MRKSFLKTSFNAGWAEEFIVKKIPSTNIQAPEKFQTPEERGRPGCSRRRRADGFRRAMDKLKNDGLGCTMCPARRRALHAGRVRSPIPAAWLKQFVISVCFSGGREFFPPLGQFIRHFNGQLFVDLVGNQQRGADRK